MAIWWLKDIKQSRFYEKRFGCKKLVRYFLLTLYILTLFLLDYKIEKEVLQ